MPVKAPIAAFVSLIAAGSASAHAETAMSSTAADPMLTSRCIVERLGRNPQVHLSDKGITISLFATRSRAAHWTIVGTASGAMVTVDHNMPGIERALRGACYSRAGQD